MKKALIDQLLLGFIALSSTIIFIATVSDDKVVRNKYSNLEDTANEVIIGLGQEYYKGMNGDLGGDINSVEDAICQAQDKITTLLTASNLGKELIDKDKISFIWKDAGTYDPITETYDGIPDGRPDSVTAKIDDYKQNTFWYKFIGKDSFNLPGFSKTADLNQYNYDVDVFFKGVIEAGYYNMVGTYELDDNGCPTNAKFILVNKDDWEDKIGETIANIKMPETRIFFIADGYRRFGEASVPNDSISLENTTITFDNPDDCTTSSSFPTAVITTDTGQVQRSDDPDVTGGLTLTSRANVYFQDEYLNFDDQSEHMHQIAQKDWGAFVAYMEAIRDWNDEAWDYYHSLENFINLDIDLDSGIDIDLSLDFSALIKKAEVLDILLATHDWDDWERFSEKYGINYDYDPNGNYVFVSEDLAATTNIGDLKRSNNHDKYNSDFDFSDMSFGMKKIFVPTIIDDDQIGEDQIMTVNCQ